jgi:hypothetical protein
MTGAWGSATLYSGEDGGTVCGIIASKGETWIGVRPEGQEGDATLYLPQWKGGLPAAGGGFDKEMLATIKGLLVGSKVELAWKTMEDHPRILSVKVLAAPEKKPEVAAAPEKPLGEGEGVRKHRHPELDRPPGEGPKVADVAKVAEVAKPHGDGERPAAEVAKPKPHGDGERPVAEVAKPKPHGDGEAGPKSGTVVGVIVAKGENSIDVRENKDTPAETYRPMWKGGLPKEGGGPDRDMLKLFASAKVNDWVKIDWVWHEGRRVSKLQIAGRQ